MSEIFINDGKGHGNRAIVTEENLLGVEAVSVPKVYHEADEHADAYCIYARHTVQTSDTEENVLYISNNSNVGHIYVWSVTLTTRLKTLTENDKFDFLSSPTYVSGGIAKTAVNTVLGSNKVLVANIYDNDDNTLTMTTSSENEMLDIVCSPYSPTHTYDFDGSIIIGKGKAFGITVESSTSGHDVRAIMYVTHHPHG